MFLYVLIDDLIMIEQTEFTFKMYASPYIKDPKVYIYSVIETREFCGKHEVMNTMHLYILQYPYWPDTYIGLNKQSRSLL